MDGNVVKLVFQTVADCSGLTKFSGTLKTTAAEAQKTINATKGIVGALSSVGGEAGGVVGKISSVVGSFAQLGAIGGVIAGVQIAFDQFAKHYMEAADKMKAKAKELADSTRAMLESIASEHMKRVTDALDEASSKARETATAFNALASAYLKVSAAQDQTAKSSRSAGMSAIQLEKSQKMAAAGTDEERAMIAAEYDRRIARANLSSATEEQAGIVRQANDGVAVTGENARLARQRVRKASKALRTAKKEYDLVFDADGNEYNPIEGVDMSGLKTKLAEAQKNYTEAINDRVAKQAEADAAEEKLLQAKNEQTAALNNARAGIVEADAAQRKLAQAQKEARDAELEKARAERAKAEAERLKAERELARNDIQKRINEFQAGKSDISSAAAGYASQFEQAFELWRDPEAAARAQDESKAREADMKRFRRAVGGYDAKWRIDEAARLMREGDAEGLETRMSEWRKSTRFTPQAEQMVRAAAAEQNKQAADRALVDIEKNTRDLAKKLDELLALKG